MNLQLNHLPKLLISAALGAFLFYFVSYVIPKGSLSSFEKVLSLQHLGLLFGAIAGMAAGIIVLVVTDSRNSQTGAAANFTSLNGTGSVFIGKSDFRPDGSYLTTEWFCIVCVPIFPVCKYRLIIQSTGHAGLSSAQKLTIVEKHTVQFGDVFKGYTITLGLITGAAIIITLINWYLKGK